MTYNIVPVSKPRMTRSDKWKKRKCVVKYFAFKDEVRLNKVILPEQHHVTFIIPMPESWSKKKQKEYYGKPHQQRPDVDNFVKGLFDAVFEEDSHIWDCRMTKIWGTKGAIKIQELI
jgi:Holliday junction resolvase RusA-like endonuclease